MARDIGVPRERPIFKQAAGCRKPVRCLFFAGFLLFLLPSWLAAAEPLLSTAGQAAAPFPRVFAAHGVVQEVQSNGQVLVIQHDAIPGYMAAMTMPFKVKETAERQWQRGDEVVFQLHVTETESWIDGITRTGTVQLPLASSGDTSPAPSVHPRHPLLDCKFTNELGQPVTLGEFHGQALALTFFFTRCPLPEFCPRLSKNFEQASEKLAALSGAPTNWHFISVSFDPEADTPEVLKAYGETYHYNPAHWSFLTGPPDKIRELAELSGVKLERSGSLINHNFRTLIIDANSHLQTTFPFGGDLSEMIVSEMLKAAAATNQTISK